MTSTPNGRPNLDPSPLTRTREPEPSHPDPHQVCGDGVRTTAEACDDNNTASGDGCSALCAVEVGFACVSSAAAVGGSGIGGLDTCASVCGDGRRILWGPTPEACEDNNTLDGDGCSAGCAVEPGYACSGGSFSGIDTCVTVCGDGLRAGGEVCDDGNQLALDGCSADCATIEGGYTCAGGSATSPDVCTPCAASCETCSGPTAEECVSCASTHPFFVSATNSCVADCKPLGMYADGSSSCAACDVACGTCSGPLASECLSCTNAATPFVSSGECVAECGNGTFVELSGASAACVPCHASCAECSGPSSTSCTSCPATATPYYDAGACVASCPAGRVAEGSSCVACDASCASCTDASATGCASCPAGGVHNASTGRCEYQCALGQYADSGTTCAACDAGCATCSGGAASCTSCAGATPALHAASCVASCPDGTYADTRLHCQDCDASCGTCTAATASDCASCDAGGATPYKHGTTCVSSCPSAHYAAGGVCRACDDGCAECDGPSAAECTACPSQAPKLFNGTCLAVCPADHFAASATSCGACDATCATCSGATAADCLTCHAPKPHLVGGACTCMAGYQASSDACTQIDECATDAHNCFGGAAYCTDLAGSFSCACPAGYTGDGVSCSDVDECAAGTALCSPQATCANAPPSPAAPLGYTCTCNTTGYWGDGFFCGDVDECTLEAALPTTSPHTCHPTARCINLDGAFECACASGYRAYYGVSGYHNETVASRL